MPWSQNAAIKNVLQQLDDVLATEVQEGRCSVSNWRVMMIDKSAVKTIGSGCQCPACQAFIAEAAMSYYEANLCAMRPQHRIIKKED